MADEGAPCERAVASSELPTAAPSKFFDTFSWDNIGGRVFSILQDVVAMLDHVDKEVLPDISTAIHGCIPLFDLGNEEEQIPGIASIFENHTLVKIPRCDA